MFCIMRRKCRIQCFHCRPIGECMEISHRSGGTIIVSMRQRLMITIDGETVTLQMTMKYNTERSQIGMRVCHRISDCLSTNCCLLFWWFESTKFHDKYLKQDLNVQIRGLSWITTTEIIEEITFLLPVNGNLQIQIHKAAIIWSDLVVRIPSC